MADVTKTIEIIFGAVDRTGGAVSSVGDGISSFSDRLGTVTGPIRGVTDDLLKIETAIALAGAALLAVSVNEASKFEDALLDLQKVLGDGETDIEAYEAQLSALSNEYGVLTTESISSAASFKEAGFTIEESLNLVDLALKAVQISNLDANQASTVLRQTLRGFGADASEAGRLLDILNAVSNNFGTSLGELGAGMATISPVAKQVGLSFEETAALLTPIIEVVGSGTEAANSLRTGLLRLTRDTGPASDALEDLGISQTNANGALRSSNDILKDLANVWPTLSDEQQTYFGGMLFGINRVTQMSALLNNFDRSLGTLNVAMEANGSAQREWEIRMQSAEIQLARLGVSVRTVAKELGQEFLPEATNVIKEMTGLSAAFAKVVDDEGLEPLFIVLRQLLNDFAGDIQEIARLLPEVFSSGNIRFDPLIDSLGNIGDSINSIFEGLDLTTAEGLTSAINEIIRLFAALNNTVAGIIQGFKPFIDQVVNVVKGFSDLSSETQIAVGQIGGAISAIDRLNPLLKTLGDVLSVAGIGIAAFAGAKGLSGAAAAMATLQAQSSGLIRVLGSAGIAGAVGLTAFEFGKWLDLNDRLIPGTATLGTALFDLKEELFGLTEQQKEFNALQASDDASFVKEQQAIDALIVDLQKLTGERTFTKLSAETLKDAEEKLADVFEKNNQIYDAATGTFKTLGAATDEAAEKTENFLTNSQGLTVLDESGNAITNFAGTMSVVGSSFDEAGEKADEATKKSDEYLTKMEEIASNERIANIEATVSLNIAEIEADAQRAVAIIEVLGTTISSTGDLLGGLFGNLEGASISERFQIEDQIRKENEIRQRAAEDAHKIAEEQIKQLQAKTEALKRGDALIQIDGAGLQPHLEAFMFEILEAIQVRANAEGSEYLLLST